MTVPIDETLEAGLTRFTATNGPARIALFSGFDSFEACGAASIVRETIGSRIACHYRGTSPPSSSAVEAILTDFLDRDVGYIVAIGGGGVIDLAKSVSLFAGQTDSTDIRGRLESEWRPAAAPILAVPTTAGSGSEATSFAVLFIGTEKYSLVHESIRPERIVLDPMLSRSVPTPVAAAAGLDVVAHCVESMWSTRSTPETIECATTTLEEVVSALPGAVLERNDAAIALMVRGAYRAGTCIAVTRTTAAHALSYRLTQTHGIAHGHAATLMLGSVLEFNAALTADTCQDPRGLDHVVSILDRIYLAFGVSTSSDTRAAMTRSMDDLGLAPDLSRLSLTPDDLSLIAGSANAERLATNPRRMTDADLVAVVEDAR